MPTNYPVSVTVGNNYAQNIVVGDTVTLTVSATWTTSSAASGCTASAASGNASSVFTLTNFLLASASYSITITTTDKSGTYYSTISGTITEALPATPTDITFSAFGTENSPNASVTATTIGTPDVTLKIGQSINSATVTAYANSPATFYQVRGSTDTYRYWAYNYRTSTVRSNFYNELNGTAPYLANETGTASNVTITSSATSATIPISGISSAGVETEISLSNNATRLGGATGSTNVTITSSLPAAGTSVSYRLLSRRPISKGGASDTWAFNDSFTITRESAATGPTAPTTIALASATQTASPTDVSVTASGGTAGSVAVVGTTVNGPFYANGAAGFTATRGTAKTFYAYNTLNGINSSTVGLSATLAFVAQGLGDYTVGTTVVTTIANTSSAITGTLTGMGTNTQYQILKDTTWIETVNGFGNGSFTIETNELPTTGNSQTYVIKGRVPATYGGTTALYPPALWTNTTHSFTITNGTATDTTPDQFSFTDVTGVATGSEPTSSITVAGIDAATAVTISGGTYSKNGGSYASASTTAVLNDTFEVKHTASSFNNTSVNTTLTIGGVSDIFTSTTIAATSDTTPDAFSFLLSFLGTPANLSTTYVYSDIITVTGINAAAAISISTGATGGAGGYSINNGSYSSATGTVVAGDRVRVRLHPAGTTGTTRSTTLTIGTTVSATFTTSTTGYTGTGLTAQAPTGITRTYMSDGEEPFRIIRATVTVGLNSFPIIRDTSGTDSGASNTFKSNNYEFYIPRGSTPTFNAYAYGYNNAAPATFSVTHGVVPYLTPSATGSLTDATIAYDASTAYTFSYISPAGHDFRIGTSNVANPSATVNSDAVTLANSTPGATYNYYIETRRTVAKGGDALTWSTPHGLGTITRGGENSTPDAFSFVDPVATNIARTSTITSPPVTLTGMDIASTVTQLSAGFTATANGSAVTLNAAVPANATLTLSTTSSGSYATSVSGSIAVGGVSSGLWTVTTQADPGTGTGGGGASAGDYGLEIRNASGTTVFSPSMRTTNFIASGTYQGLAAGATSTAIPSEGMTTNGEIAVLIDCPGQSTFVPDFTVTRGTNSFTIKNNSSVSVDVNWMTVRY